MNAELKQNWVDALRSGRYLKGEGEFRVKDNRTGEERFCFLGVLCDVMDPGGWRPETCEDEDFTYYDHRLGYHGIAAILGVPTTLLWSKNDGEGGKAFSFDELATWIEHNVETN